MHSRVLLDLQDEITSLEKELDEVDWDDFDEEPDRLRSREIDMDRSDGENDTRNRRVILREIREKLMEYGMYPSLAFAFHALYQCLDELY